MRSITDFASRRQWRHLGPGRASSSRSRCSRPWRGSRSPVVSQDPAYHRFRRSTPLARRAPCGRRAVQSRVRARGPRGPRPARFSQSRALRARDRSRHVVHRAWPHWHGAGLRVVSPRSARCDARLGSPADDAGVCRRRSAPPSRSASATMSSRASLALLVALGIVSVAYWKLTGNLSPYLSLQFGGIGALLLLLLLTRRGG